MSKIKPAAALIVGLFVLGGVNAGRDRDRDSDDPTYRQSDVSSTPDDDAPSDGSASVAVTPASGPVGTAVSFAGSGFASGDSLTFRVRMPNGATYSGPPHRVPGTGAVAATWRTSDINPPGEYTVSAVADSGETAEATFRLTPPGG